MHTSTTKPLRIAGSIILAGVVLTIAGSLATVPADGVGSFDRTAWVLIHLLLVVGGAALLLGLPAIYVRQSDHVGLTGLIGFGLLFIGFLGIGFFTPAVQTFLLPWVYDKASCTLGCHLLNTSDGPPLWGWFNRVTIVATGAGLILFGLRTARATVFPPTAGFLMVIAGVASLPLAFVNPPALLAVLPETVGLLAVGWLSLDLMSRG